MHLARTMLNRLERKQAFTLRTFICIEPFSKQVFLKVKARKATDEQNKRNETTTKVTEMIGSLDFVCWVGDGTFQSQFGFTSSYNKINQRQKMVPGKVPLNTVRFHNHLVLKQLHCRLTTKPYNVLSTSFSQEVKINLIFIHGNAQNHYNEKATRFWQFLSQMPTFAMIGFWTMGLPVSPCIDSWPACASGSDMLWTASAALFHVTLLT